MNRILVLCTLLSVVTLSFSALQGNNRYGGQNSGNSLNHRGVNRYPSGPHGGRAPLSRSYSGPSSPRLGGHQSGPAPYGGGRHLNAQSANLNQYSGSNAGLGHYSGPSARLGPLSGGSVGGLGHLSGAGAGFGHLSGPSSYGGPVNYGGSASGPSHYSSPKRSVYQSQQTAHSTSSRSNYPQQSYSQQQQHAETRSQTSGREMKYTIRDPQNRGTTHVTETHVVSNRQMHGAEAEAAMKKLMGSMGPSYGSDGGFQDFVKDMGLPFY